MIKSFLDRETHTFARNQSIEIGAGFPNGLPLFLELCDRVLLGFHAISFLN
jgi:hypothetical protein